MPIGGVGDIHWLLVDKRFQGKGIGRQLVDAYIKDAKKHGAHAIHLYSSEVNTAFYEKLGFEKVGLVRKNYWGSDDYFMNLVMT
jgi:ribosomal protein S18 acetylase RimI-like enzyme